MSVHSWLGRTPSILYIHRAQRLSVTQTLAELIAARRPAHVSGWPSQSIAAAALIIGTSPNEIYTLVSVRRGLASGFGRTLQLFVD